MSVEDTAHTTRIRHLKQIRSDARFVSFEPLLSPIGDVDLAGIAWAIVGGESGPRSRAMDEAWVKGIRDLCDRDAVSFFFKQWGGARPKSGGRLLDGVEWNGFPWQVARGVTERTIGVSMFFWPIEEIASAEHRRTLGASEAR